MFIYFTQAMFYLTLTILRETWSKGYVNKYTLVQIYVFTINGIYLNTVDCLVHSN